MVTRPQAVTSKMGEASASAAQRGRLRYYLAGQSTSVGRYMLEQTLFCFLRGLPGLIGIGLRAFAYRLILHSQGLPVVEDHVRLCMPGNIHLGRNVYLDYGVYLHACPQGIFVGDDTFIMHGSELHVYNFRELPNSGIWVGRNGFIGESCIIRGQGGVHIGEAVLLAPGVQILAIDHLFGDRSRPIMQQGISAQGITIDDGAWLGAGAIVLDGVHVGTGAVVGAGAVVTHDVPPHTLVGGVPARVIKSLGTENHATE